MLGTSGSERGLVVVGSIADRLDREVDADRLQRVGERDEVEHPLLVLDEPARVDKPQLPSPSRPLAR